MDDVYRTHRRPDRSAYGCGGSCRPGSPEARASADGVTVALACAHPAKLPDAVEKATGLRPALPPELVDLMTRPGTASGAAK